MLVAVVFAGLAYPVTASALHSTTPAVIATSRAVGGGLVMLLVVRWFGSRLPATRRDWGLAGLIGAANVTLTLIGISEGTALAGAAIASVLLNSSPFFAALLGRIWLGERITRLRAAGMAVGFAGVVIVGVTGSSGGAGSNAALGVVFCMIGALGWAVAGLAMRFLSTSRADFDVYGTTTAQFLCGGALLIPYLAFTGHPLDSTWSSARMWSSLAFLVVGAQVIVYIGFYVGISRWTSARAFAWTFLAPVVAVSVEAALGHLPSWLTCLGMAAVIAGVYVVNHPRAEAAAVPS